jgi:amidase
MISDHDYSTLDGLALAAKVARRETTAVALLDARFDGVPVHPEVAQAVRLTGRTLAGLGHVVAPDAPRLDVIDGLLVDYRVGPNGIAGYSPFTPLANVTGQPAISVPAGWSNGGLPIGVQLVGRFGEDATLLALAAEPEVAAPWAGRRPPPH